MTAMTPACAGLVCNLENAVVAGSKHRRIGLILFFCPLALTTERQDQHEATRLKLHYGDLADGTVLRRIVEAVKPHEVYNLAAQSHVRVSFLEPEYTADVTGLGALRLLDVLRDVEENLGWKYAASAFVVSRALLTSSSSQGCGIVQTGVALSSFSGQVLPGRLFGNVWRHPAAAGREDALSPAVALCSVQGESGAKNEGDEFLTRPEQTTMG